MTFFRVTLLFLSASVVLAAPMTAAEDPDVGLRARLGDINRDGSCDIRDIQASVSQALGASDATYEGDMDENGMVDIFDVQHMVNTALEAGGMVQQVRGSMAYDAETFPEGMHIRAMSEDGQSMTAEVDPRTGEFSMRLQTGTAWAFASMANGDQSGQGTFGAMQFPLADQDSVVVPMPELSLGDELDLGEFQFGAVMRAQMDIRSMHGGINGRLDVSDADGDGIPDFAAPLMRQAHRGPGVFEDMEMGTLNSLVAPCIETWLDEMTEPSLTDTNEDGVPDFVDPLVTCLTEQIPVWFEFHGHGGGMMGGSGGMMGGGSALEGELPQYVQKIIDYVVAAIPEWIASLEQPDLIDLDGNGIPDFLDAVLETPGGLYHADADGDGVPDFAQDDDEDGIPNCLDEDAWTLEDCDGDGIPNHWDRDDDNDEILDYADETPCGDEIL
jgi:hypothetical protein